MTENQKQPIPEIQEEEQKTFDSEPVTFEEMQRLQEDFYSDDLSGGLQNIEVSEEEIQRQNEQYEIASGFIDMEHSTANTPCYRTDLVSLKLTPEELFVMTKLLEAISLNMTHIDYLESELKMDGLYEQQSYVRRLHDITDDKLIEYAQNRPYNPFLPTWFKKVGLIDVDKEV